MRLIGNVTYTLAIKMPAGNMMHIRATYLGGSLCDSLNHHIAGGRWCLGGMWHRSATRSSEYIIDATSTFQGPGRDTHKPGIITLKGPWYVVPRSGVTDDGSEVDDAGNVLPLKTRSEAMLAWLFEKPRNQQQFIRHSVKSILEAK